MKKVLKLINNKFVYFLVIVIQIVSLFTMATTIKDIYYTGFKNKGFNTKVVDKITTETYDKLALLIRMEDFEYFDSCYNYDKKKDVYTLKKEYDEVKLSVITREIIPMHYLFYEGLQSGKDEVLGIKEYKDIYNILNGYNKAQKTYFLDDARKEVKKLSSREIDEIIIKDSQLEYKKLGYKLNDIKNKYIKDKFILLGLYTLLIVGISILNTIIRKKTNKEYKKLEVTQNIILLLITLIYMLIIKHILTIILIGIYLFILLCVWFVNILRRKNETYNEAITKIENAIDIHKQKEMNYIIKWVILIIALFIVNIIIYHSYTNYHLFVGVDAYTMQSHLIYYLALIINIFIARGLFFNIMDYCIEYRPEIRKKKPVRQNKISAPKNTTSKSKSKTNNNKKKKKKSKKK